MQPFGLLFLGKMNKKLFVHYLSLQLCLSWHNLRTESLYAFQRGNRGPMLAICPGKAGVRLPTLLTYQPDHPAGPARGALFLSTSPDNCQRATTVCCGLRLLPFSQGPQLINLCFSHFFQFSTAGFMQSIPIQKCYSFS